jgi:hypothetical protein
MHATQIEQQHLCLKFCHCFGSPKSRAILKSDKLDENSVLYRDDEDTSEYIRSIFNFCLRAANGSSTVTHTRNNGRADMMKKEKTPKPTNSPPKERRYLNHCATNIRTPDQQNRRSDLQNCEHHQPPPHVKLQVLQPLPKRLPSLARYQVVCVCRVPPGVVFARHGDWQNLGGRPTGGDDALERPKVPRT